MLEKFMQYIYRLILFKFLLSNVNQDIIFFYFVLSFFSVLQSNKIDTFFEVKLHKTFLRVFHAQINSGVKV